jgi:hypothetical protein
MKSLSDQTTKEKQIHRKEWDRYGSHTTDRGRRGVIQATSNKISET